MKKLYDNVYLASFGRKVIKLRFDLLDASLVRRLVCSRGTCVVSGGGGCPLQLLYEPGFFGGSRLSNRTAKCCIYDVSFIMPTCTLVFPQYVFLGSLFTY